MTDEEVVTKPVPVAGRIGEILVRQGYLNEGQLEKALQLQQELAQRGVRHSLGEICVAEGWCEMRHVAEAMRLQQERTFEATTLGQVLIDMGAITLKELDEAMAHHQDESADLATFLVERGYSTQQQVETATEIQHIRRATALRQQTLSLYNPFNVMELVVNEMLDGVIGETEGCTCEVCRANAFALTLNELPTRYVSEHSRVLLVAQRTRDEYGTLIRRKITEAVQRVKKNPRPHCRQRKRSTP